MRYVYSVVTMRKERIYRAYICTVSTAYRGRSTYYTVDAGLPIVKYPTLRTYVRRDGAEVDRTGGGIGMYISYMVDSLRSTKYSTVKWKEVICNLQYWFRSEATAGVPPSME